MVYSKDIKVEFLPCSSLDRVCHKGRNSNWFFMYTCVLSEVGVRFPFTEFECAVLRQLNCAPTQSHPNSWGFIRAFEILMEYLQEELSVGLFFYLFQAKGVDRGIWVALSSHQGRTVFSLFKATYRDFKSFYAKVTSSKDVLPFFLDENHSEKFPLYWSESLGGKVLTTSELLKWDSNRGAVVKYLETKVPDCSTAGLKSFFKQKAKRELSTSNVVKVKHGSEVNKPSDRKKGISIKRMRSEDTSGKKIVDLTERKCCGRDISLEEVARFAKSQEGLHGFCGAEDLSSLWCEHYPFAIVAEEHFQSKGDLDLLKKAGKVVVARYLQVQAAQLMCISQKWENEAVEEEVDLKEKEIGLLKDENGELKSKLVKLSKDKQDLEGRIVELYGEKKELEESKKNHGFDMFAIAWEKAKAQAELFAPGVKFEKMDPLKVVYKGG
ncbi:hypothetical protein PIB30_043925 [Stylosanthes scabra]|uniref:Uncharacterized protein n=1 Tax=Stylosanthes scabra TaxID=79078 RepID=A0ABU6WG04_9FABA|nr:hypothetical protein [Stylosanthes scabra]